MRVILERPKGLRRLLSWTTYRFSDQVLCVSNAVRKKMIPPEVNHVRTLYNPGPDLDRFDPRVAGQRPAIRHELGIAQDTFVVGLVSKFVPPKGHFALIEAARMIQALDPAANITYVLVGGRVAGHERYFSEVCERIEQYALKRNFVLTGARDDVPELVTACDVMVHLPQHHDPFPGVVLEAMAMEKPIVAFASGGIPEQLEHGRSGILLEQDDIESLARSLLTLAQDVDLRVTMGKEGRRFLTSHFSRERFFSELGRIYAGLVAMTLPSE